MPTLLLTRPRPDSERLASVLRQRGYATLIAPMMAIRAMTTPRPVGEAPLAVMITSRNAVDALADRRGVIGDLLELPCFCVGTQTAQAAREYGFKDVRDAGGDGAALATLVADSEINPFKPILHIAGLHVAATASDPLTEAGYTVKVWPVYTADPITTLPENVTTALHQQAIDGVMLFSPRTGRIFAELLAARGLNQSCATMSAFGLSAAVLESIMHLPWLRLIAPALPTEVLLVQHVTDLLPVEPTP